MPLPFLIPAALAALGIGSHMTAKQKNEKAQETLSLAQSIYNNKKFELEVIQDNTGKTLTILGETKKEIYSTSIKQFISSYEKVKTVKLGELANYNELSNFLIDDEGTLELVKMGNIYEKAISSASAGTATGAIVALAVNGSLPLVTGTLSLAGTALTFGEIGTAISLTGSAVSMGALMTPFTAIAAPVVLFTGFSSNKKANENLEKAVKVYSDAEVAVEQMKNSIVLCEGIMEKANMFNSLLNELNGMFVVCNSTLDRMIKSYKVKENGKIDISKLNNEDMEVIAVTRALAGAIKTVLDTPILDEKGNITTAVQSTYESVTKELPYFKDKVSDIEVFKEKYFVKKGVKRHNKEKKNSKKITKIICIIIIISLILIGKLFFYNDNSNNASDIENTTSNVENVTGDIKDNESIIEPVEKETDAISDTESNNSSENVDDIVLDNNIVNSGELTDTITWKVNNQKTLYLSGNGEIPDSNIISDVYVICVENSIEKIVIEEGVTSIGVRAFSEVNVSEVCLPNSLISISNAAFTNSKIETITIPSNVKYIGHDVFSYCSNLTDVYIMNPDIEIEKYTFDYSLNVVLHGNSNSSVEEYANENQITFNKMD